MPVRLVERPKAVVGVIGVPTSVSVTVTVQDEVLGGATGLVHVIVVLVDRKLAVTVKALLELVLWVESPL